MYYHFLYLTYIFVTPISKFVVQSKVNLHAIGLVGSLTEQLTDALTPNISTLIKSSFPGHGVNIE